MNYFIIIYISKLIINKQIYLVYYLIKTIEIMCVRMPVT
jgi:hypothetical protein